MLVLARLDVHDTVTPEEMFRRLGYAEYDALDMGNHGITCDLNLPLPVELRGRYDLVYDHGTVEHVMDVIQALRNMLTATRVGGLLVHHQFIGDQTNAGYWTVSPNFYADWYEANGCRVLASVLFNRRGHTTPYVPIVQKTTTVGSLLPFRHVPGYYCRLFRLDLLLRALRGRRWVKKVLFAPHHYRMPRLQRVFNAIAGIGAGGPDWGMFVIARKCSEERGHRIQNIYRS